MIEPGYKNKYPPLGLMKIASYHKAKGDIVTFVKGTPKEIRAELILRELTSDRNYKPELIKFIVARKGEPPKEMEELALKARERYRKQGFPFFDRVYVTTLFTFHWKATVEAINNAKKFCCNWNKELFVGGIAASLVPDKIYEETGVRPISGLLDKGGELDEDDDSIIDRLTPDYSILEQISYKYPSAGDTYFGYMTKGCVRKCPFCAVPRLEPRYVPYIGIKDSFSEASKTNKFTKIVLMDNNVLASPELSNIVNELAEIGAYKGGNITIDFNQGLDARLFTKKKAEILAKLNLHPLRIAFDHWEDREIYEKAIRLAVEAGVGNTFSNYLLYNFEDKPEDLYNRMALNIRLSDELNAHVYSFPMKYQPLDNPDYFSNRLYVGKHWNLKFIRAIQNLLIVTRGGIGPGRKFFEYAFGKDIEEFIDILWTPEVILRHRKEFASEWDEWKEKFHSLEPKDKNEVQKYIATNDMKLMESVKGKEEVLFYYYKWGDGKNWDGKK